MVADFTMAPHSGRRDRLRRAVETGLPGLYSGLGIGKVVLQVASLLRAIPKHRIRIVFASVPLSGTWRFRGSAKATRNTHRTWIGRLWFVTEP